VSQHPRAAQGLLLTTALCLGSPAFLLDTTPLSMSLLAVSGSRSTDFMFAHVPLPWSSMGGHDRYRTSADSGKEGAAEHGAFSSGFWMEKNARDA
jgi:hypothetical protein